MVAANCLPLSWRAMSCWRVSKCLASKLAFLESLLGFSKDSGGAPWNAEDLGLKLSSGPSRFLSGLSATANSGGAYKGFGIQRISERMRLLFCQRKIEPSLLLLPLS